MAMSSNCACPHTYGCPNCAWAPGLTGTSTQTTPNYEIKLRFPFHTYNSLMRAGLGPRARGHQGPNTEYSQELK